MNNTLSDDVIRIKGTVEDIQYKNPDNGYIVALLDVDNEPVTAVGELGLIDVGESVISLMP